MNNSMVPVFVKGVAMHSPDSTPMVILEETGGQRSLMVSVGAFEAGAIILGMEGLGTPRPLTHSLLAEIMKEQGLHIRAIEIYGLYDGGEAGFLARMTYGRGIRLWTRDVRPSDALALAIETQAPILAHASLLMQKSDAAGEPCLSGQPQENWYYLEAPQVHG
jgi:bifunctional DNase/RNase